MSLPQLSFNLISVSKLTRTHHCNISFFPNHCLIQDLLTKRIIGRGRESRVSTSLKQRCQSLLLVLELLPHLNYIVSWVIILSLLKKLYPQFSIISSLICELCQYAKLHRMHLSHRVNKGSFISFELVHSDVWGPCPVMFPTRFMYFVTFVDDFSHVTWLYLIKSRFKLFSHFSALCAEIQTQFHVSV